MPIPATISYAMPRPDDLPQNQVRWRVEPSRAVLLVHDMQRFFIKPFSRDVAPATALLRHTALLREAATALGLPVVYTAQPGDMTSTDRGLLHDFWGPGMGSGTLDTQIIDELAPTKRDVVLTKWRYSAFRHTELLDLLRGSGRDQLIVTGVYAHVGCLMTACEAFGFDIRPFVVGDAVADFSSQEHNMALRYVAARCGATPSTSALLQALGSGDLAAEAA